MARGDAELEVVGLERRQRELGLLAGAQIRLRRDLELEVRSVAGEQLVAGGQRGGHACRRPVVAAGTQERDAAVAEAQPRRRELEAERLVLAEVCFLLDGDRILVEARRGEGGTEGARGERERQPE